MKVAEILRARRRVPFRPIAIDLDSGVTYAVRHPEAFFVSQDIIVTLDERGQTVFIAPESVSAIRLLHNGKSKR